MKNLVTIISFILFSTVMMGQQNEVQNPFSLGYVTEYNFQEHGGFMSYQYNKHSIRVQLQNADKIYYFPKLGPTNGYAWGISYIYDKKFDVEKIYKSKLLISYVNKYIECKDYADGGGDYSIKFDGVFTSNEFRFGYIGSFNYKNLELQIIPFLSAINIYLKGYNVVETYDPDNHFDTKSTEVIRSGIWPRIAYEMSLGYRF